MQAVIGDDNTRATECQGDSGHPTGKAAHMVGVDDAGSAQSTNQTWREGVGRVRPLPTDSSQRSDA